MFYSCLKTLTYFMTKFYCNILTILDSDILMSFYLIFGLLKQRTIQDKQVIIIATLVFLSLQCVGHVFADFLVFHKWIIWVTEGFPRIHLSVTVQKRGKWTELCGLLLILSPHNGILTQILHKINVIITLRLCKDNVIYWHNIYVGRILWNSVPSR